RLGGATLGFLTVCSLTFGRLSLGGLTRVFGLLLALRVLLTLRLTRPTLSLLLITGALRIIIRPLQRPLAAIFGLILPSRGIDVALALLSSASFGRLTRILVGRTIPRPADFGITVIIALVLLLRVCITPLRCLSILRVLQIPVDDRLARGNLWLVDQYLVAFL